MFCIGIFDRLRLRSGYSILAITTMLILGVLLHPKASADQQKNIVIIGDSLSAAYNIPVQRSWPQLLQAKLDENNLPYRIINTSISGDTSYTALNRSKKTLPQLKPDVCFIAIGANDGLQGLSLKQLKTNLHSIIELCKQHTNKIMLFEMKVPLNYGTVFVKRFSNIYHQVAKKERIKLLPFFIEPFASDLTMFLPDRIHPAEQAQPLLSDSVYRGFIELQK